MFMSSLTVLVMYCSQGLICLHLNPAQAVQRVIDGWFEDRCSLTGVRKRTWEKILWDQMQAKVKTFHTLDTPYFRDMVTVQPEAAPFPDNAPTDMDVAQPAEDDVPADPDLEKARVALMVSRTEEEADCKVLLADLDWLMDIPVDAETQGEWEALEREVQQYVAGFTWNHSKRHPYAIRNCRLITVECMRMLQYLHCKGWLPKNITNPNDRYIRYAADRNCSDHFVDPGNVAWDILFNVLRLDQYVVSWRAEMILRVSPSVYGSGTNK